MNSEAQKPHAEEPGSAAPWLFGIWAVVTALWFAFAFAPSTGQDQSWLKAAQAVCFGTQDNGLPSDWGWVVMILGPLSMLAGLIGAFASEMTSWARRRPGSARLGLILFSLIAMTQARWIFTRVRDAAELFSAFEKTPAEGPLPGSYPRLHESPPHFSLIGRSGQRVTESGLKGAPTVLCFIYASCATVCPFLVRDTLRAVAAQPGSRAVFITLDPWRDTPAALPGIGRRYGMGAESQILSGEPARVVALLNKLGVASLRDPLSGEILHPPLVIVLDSKGRIAYRFMRPSTAWLSEALSRLQKET